jgi:hypothetical protein
METATESEPQTTPAEAWADAALAVEASADWEPLGDPYVMSRRAPLTLARKAEVLDEARDLRARRAALVDEKRDTAKRLGTAIQALDDQLDELLDRAKLGEHSTAKVQREIRASNVRLIDIDTGEVVEERAATQAELQRELDLEDESDDGADDVDDHEEHELGGEG